MRPLKIGITGAVGSGKSTVTGWLADRGAAVLDADELAHRLLAGDRVVRDAVVDRFGAVVLVDGTIDRRVLAGIVFADASALADLERLVHPAIVSACREWLIQSVAPVLVVEAVKLVESGLSAALDEVWLVVCPREVRRLRLAERGWSADEIDRRMAADPGPRARLAAATVVIDNGGGRADTELQTSAAFEGSRRRHAAAMGQEANQ